MKSISHLSYSWGASHHFPVLDINSLLVLKAYSILVDTIWKTNSQLYILVDEDSCAFLCCYSPISMGRYTHKPIQHPITTRTMIIVVLVLIRFFIGFITIIEQWWWIQRLFDPDVISLSFFIGVANV